LLTINFIFALLYAVSFYASFFFTVRFAFTGASTEAGAVVFLEDALFICALIAFLLLDTPKEPFVRFPFAVFLSPLPMFQINWSAIIVKYLLNAQMFGTFFQKILTYRSIPMLLIRLTSPHSMATPSLEIIRIIRRTCLTLSASNNYEWGHMGACNCGFLAREVTHLSKAEIHVRALQRSGDWSEQLNDYCSTSGLPMDDVITDLFRVGFTERDLKNLERLTDTDVLALIPEGRRQLQYNRKEDVLLYLRTWTELLESQLIKSTKTARDGYRQTTPVLL
jgi:hypothetical protein